MGYRNISDDLKLAAVHLRNRGLDSVSEIMNITGISRSELYRIWRQHRDTGTVAKALPIGRGRPRSLAHEDAQHLLSLARYKPTLFLDEYCRYLERNRHLKVSLSTIHKTFERAGLSVKRVQKMASERSPAKRANYVRRIGQYSAACLFCIDEVSKDDRTYARLWGRSRLGSRAEIHAPFVRGRRLSMIAGLVLDEGIRAARVIEGSYTKDLFLDYLQTDVLPLTTPFPGPRSVIVMDNARIHKSPEVRELIESHGCRLEYLPPYSPDYQPIEQAFSVIKSHLRRNGQSAFLARSMYHEMYAACDVITPEMTWGFFSHSGYL